MVQESVVETKPGSTNPEPNIFYTGWGFSRGGGGKGKCAPENVLFPLTSRPQSWDLYSNVEEFIISLAIEINIKQQFFLFLAF